MSDFRLMAEAAVDLACRKLGRQAACRTAELTLDGGPPAGPNRGRPPSDAVSKFLRRHPTMREWNALAHLAGSFVRHTARRLGEGRASTAAELLARYGA
jgi:glycerol-3-phosphate dehydrogenase